MRACFALGSLLFVVACVGDDNAKPDASSNDAAPDVTADVGTKDAANDVTSSDAGPDAPPAFDPSQLADLALWLEADSAQLDVSSKVSTWSDKSSHHNDAKQSVEANAPDLSGAAINGHKAVHFGGTQTLTIADSASMQWGKTFVVEVIVRHPQAASGADTRYVFWKQSGSANFPGPDLWLQSTTATNFPSFVWSRVDKNTSMNTQAQSAIADAVPHRIRFSWDGSNESLQVDKSSAVVSTFTGVTGVDAVGATAYVGGTGFGGSTDYIGDIAEIVVVAGTTVSGAEVTDVETYLDKKYAL